MLVRRSGRVARGQLCVLGDRGDRRAGAGGGRGEKRDSGRERRGRGEAVVGVERQGRSRVMTLSDGLHSTRPTDVAKETYLYGKRNLLRTSSDAQWRGKGGGGFIHHTQ